MKGLEPVSFAMGYLASTRRRGTLAVLTAAAGALVVAAAGAGAPPSIKQKEAQAQSVLQQIQALGLQLNRTSEAYDGARYRLGEIEASRRKNAVALRQAKAGYRAAEQRAAARLVAIYESGEPTTADALLGAASVTDILDRIDAVNSTTALDRSIVRRVSTMRVELAARASALAVARRQQQQTVADLAAKRREIDDGLRRESALRDSIQSQIQTLEARERARQQRLLEAAKARLVLEQQQAAAAAAAARARAERDRAQQEAAAAAARAAATPTTTSAAPADPPATTTAPAIAATPATTTATPAPPPVAPPTASGHPQAATIALRYLGVPYLWSGATPKGFDCSGLVMYVYAQLGVALPHYAAAQYSAGVPVPRSDLQPGDLVFFDGLNHVGIWLGGNQFVDAPQTGDVVKIESLTSWYAANYVGARRV